MARHPRVRLALSILGALALALWSAAPAAPAAAQAPPARSGPKHAPDEVLIQFKPGAGDAQKAAARSRANASKKKDLRVLEQGDLEVASIPPGLPVAEAVRRVESDPAVAFAEPNWIHEHQATSNDPYYTNGSLWGMYGDASSPANQYGSQAGEAWATNGAGNGSVYVCVIDEGIDYGHEDLAANVWGGYDFFHNDSTIYDPADGDDHGTHVAGTIGAVGGNGKGVAGVNWNVKLISAKFLGPQGGSTSDAVEAVDYCTNQKLQQGLNVVASNNSWGGGGYSQALHGAIIRAAKAGILFVAAAGNGGSDGQGDNNDATPFYPSSFNTTQGTATESAASYDGVISVTALTSSGAKSTWANYGPTTVDIAAPGSGVYSTTPNNGYSSYSGTSMATPHVTGAIALYASVKGGSAAAIKQAILNSAVFTSSMDNRTVTEGRLDVNAALGASGPPPTADFTIGASPVSRTINQGQSTSYAVTLTALNGYSSPVDLTVSGLPSGVSGSFSPNPVTPDGDGNSSTLTITTTASAATGTHTLSIRGTGQDSGATTHTTNVTLVINSAASGTTMHVGDLDGSSVNLGNSWQATVTIAVHAADEGAVSGAVVNGIWSNGASGSASCTTSGAGTCSVSSPNIRKKNGSVTFTVNSVTHASRTYQPSANHDPDGSSNGTTITVAKP